MNSADRKGRPRLIATIFLAGFAVLGLALGQNAMARGNPANENPAGVGLVLEAEVSAAEGGEFNSGPGMPGVTVTIPPGALTKDATLVVRAIGARGELSATQNAASGSFRIGLKSRGKGKLALSMPMKIALAVEAPPQHPQIAEIATLDEDTWMRQPASFYRPSQAAVVTLSSDTRATYRAIHRELQTDSGEAVVRGRDVFMYDTFGNEDFFGGVLGLHTLLNGVAPAAAVGLGVQVDINRVPQPIVDVMIGDDFAAKQAALQDPAVTRALIKSGAVIGVVGRYADPASDVMTSAAITCGLCHVTAKPTEFELAPGQMVALPIGQPQFDGVPNSALDAGAILALTPTAQAVGLSNLLNGWGPGRFDVRALDLPNIDRNPLEDGVDNPTEYPPIWNFVDLSEQGYLIGWDGLFVDNGVSNNALASISEAVYDLIFHGNGAFAIPPFAVDGGIGGGTFPPELSIVPPQALVDALIESELERPGNDVLPPAKLLDMQTFMRSIASPAPADFDEILAEKGFELFHGEAGCANCHASAEFTGPGLHSITATAPAGGLAAGIKVGGLRGISHTAPYFHDGSAANLAAVVDRYVERGMGTPSLNAAEREALVEYLGSL
jgi:hypothetical protein